MAVLTIEEALRSLISSFGAVSALGVGDAIRVFAFEAGDQVPDGTPGILICPEHEDFENDLTPLGGARSLRCQIKCVAGTYLSARQLAEAVRENGTSPGTGLANFAGTVTVGSKSAVIERSVLSTTDFEFDFLVDGSDEKWFAVGSGYVIDYAEFI